MRTNVTQRNRLWRAMGIGLFLVGMGAGCQGTPPSPTAAAIDHASFPQLWAAYTRCVNTSDVDSARRQAALLHQAAYRDQETRTFLPTTVDKFVEKPPTRLAADPRDLASACRSHADRIEGAQALR